MTRWLWLWFFLLLSFPVIQPIARTRAATLPAAAIRLAVADGPAANSAWGGPLAGVIGELDWVEGHETSARALAGRVVIVEFWAFDCVNCRRTQAAIHALTRRYADSGAHLVSIHTPELPNERDPANVARAVAAAGIDYPVALDPEGRAWNAFENRYWPCLYVLDGAGRVRYKHIGELHVDSQGWKDLVRRIDLLQAAAKPAAPRAG